MIKINKVYKIDCLIGMKLIKDESIDFIICDLPYGMTKYKWDSPIPFELLWEQYNRIIKPTGVVALFGSEPFSTKCRMSNFSQCKYDWYWIKKKSNGFQNAKNRPMQKVETISIFSKAPTGHISLLGDKRMQYNPQGLVSAGIKVVRSSSHGRTPLGSRPSQAGKEYESFTNFPSNVLIYDNVWGKNAIHPTQKPVELIEYLIKTYSNEGDLVLDNCMGSGTTAIACINTNRNFIGFELNKDYYNICVERIKNRNKLNG